MIAVGDAVTVIDGGSSRSPVWGRVMRIRQSGFEADVVEDDQLAGWSFGRVFTDEGITWIREHHFVDSPESRALAVAYALAFK